MGWLILFLLAGVAAYDLTQRKHAILRNFPIIGHLRFLLESVGPELRQYIVTGNDEERPFSRDQRRWIYSSSKKQNEYFGFGTDNDLELSPNYLVVRHSAFPLPQATAGEPGFDPEWKLPCAKVLGGARRRSRAFRPASVVNVSGMSFGSLSGPAIEALNRGSAIAGCLQNTGEGGISSHHRHGGELVWQIGTGYFGARDEAGRFDAQRFRDTVASAPVRAVEIKLSQGAKPGLGGVLPAAKVSAEIAAIRGVPEGRPCISPAHHAEFRSADELLDFVERLADLSGLPVGIKSAVGDPGFWIELADLMKADEGRGIDFVTIDGGEGGTGAAPLSFCDHVAVPFKVGFSRVFRIFAEREIDDRVVFAGSGKLGFPESALFAMSLGCDLVHVGREAMMSIGCIQAQRCHTGHCPAGIATQNNWLMRGLDPAHKASRLANYVVALRRELTRLSHACGVPHPALVLPRQLELLDDRLGGATVAEHFEYRRGWGELPDQLQAELRELMDPAGAHEEVATLQPAPHPTAGSASAPAVRARED